MKGALAGVHVAARRHPTVAALVLFIVMAAATSGGAPASDDARFYVPAAESYGTWLEGALTFDGAAWSRAGIDRAFGVNAEHPPVGKYAMAIGWLVLHRWTGLLDALSACRVGVVLLWALMCAVLTSLVGRVASPASGLFAGLSVALMPRLVYHGHAETLDAPMAALALLSIVALFDAMESPSRWKTWKAILLFAAALGTKLNAPFLLVAAVAYVLLLSPVHVTRRSFTLPDIPLALLGMVVVSPFIALASWPWMWFDTAARLNQYGLFHLQHYPIYFYYGGTLYAESIAPWTAPWVMAALTIPVPTLLAIVLGAGRPLWAALGQAPGIVARTLATGDALHASPRLRLGLLALLAAGAQLAAVSLPTVPKYGGIKLFLPAFPFLAILAGFGFFLIEREVHRAIGRTWRPWVLAGTFVALLTPSMAGVVMYRGAWLSYYNVLAGGLPGAVARGYERQYYDLAYPELAALLSEHLPTGGSVAFLPNPKEYSPHVGRWQQEGALPPTVRLASPDRADVLVLTHERRWKEYPALQAKYRTRPVLARYTRFGVPLFTIYDLRAE